MSWAFIAACRRRTTASADTPRSLPDLRELREPLRGSELHRRGPPALDWLVGLGQPGGDAAQVHSAPPLELARGAGLVGERGGVRELAPAAEPPRRLRAG